MEVIWKLNRRKSKCMWYDSSPSEGWIWNFGEFLLKGWVSQTKILRLEHACLLLSADCRCRMNGKAPRAPGPKWGTDYAEILIWWAAGVNQHSAQQLAVIDRRKKTVNSRSDNFSNFWISFWLFRFQVVPSSPPPGCGMPFELPSSLQDRD